MVPSYQDEELKLNSYRMYYKTYSYWSTKCQAKYSTTYVAEQGSIIGNVAFLSFPLFLTTVSFYGIVFIAQTLFLIF